MCCHYRDDWLEERCDTFPFGRVKATCRIKKIEHSINVQLEQLSCSAGTNSLTIESATCGIINTMSFGVAI